MTKNPTEKLWLVGGGLGALVLLLIGYFFFISPQRSDTDDLDAQATAARQQNGTLSSRIDALRVQNKDLAKYQAQLVKAHAALPTTSGLSDFLRTLQSIGSATSTNVSSLTVGAPKNVSAVAGTGTASTAGTSAPSGAAPSSAAPTSAAGAAGTAGAAGAAAGNTGSATGIFGLPITAVVSGSTTAMNSFLQQLQSVQPRAVLITALTQGDAASTSGATTGSGMQMTITMQAFVAPASPAENASLAKAANR